MIHRACFTRWAASNEVETTQCSISDCREICDSPPVASRAPGPSPLLPDKPGEEKGLAHARLLLQLAKRIEDEHAKIQDGGRQNLFVVSRLLSCRIASSFQERDICVTLSSLDIFRGVCIKQWRQMCRQNVRSMPGKP